MSLRGSLETVDLAEVLEFLSATGKTGKLHLHGPGGEGTLWFSDGRLAGFSTRNTHDPSEAIFEMLRIDDAEFTFVSDLSDDRAAEDGGRGDWEVAPALATAREKLVEWVAIVETVPSLDHSVELVAEVDEEITLRPDQWSLVVAVGAGRRVVDLLEACRLSEFEGCRAVRDLVVAGLAGVREPKPEAALEPAGHPTVSGFEGGSATLGWIGTGDLEPQAEYETYAGDETAGGDVDEADDERAETGEVETGEVETEPDEPAATAGDPYAALRAAMLSIGEDFVAEPGAEDTAGDRGTAEVHGDVQGCEGYDSGDRPAPGRAALEALLAEVGELVPADDPYPTVGTEQVDGLADRDPWTDDELDGLGAMGGWVEEGAADPAGHEAEDAYEETYVPDDGGTEDATTAEEAPSEEPINRGLLLKFLSSVRN